MAKPSTKSLILSLLAVLINFLTYFTFRLFFFKEVPILEGISFTIYESVWHFIIIGGVSYLMFKGTRK